MPLHQTCYCAQCDLYFDSITDRAAHIQETATHPECGYCKRRFLNNNTLRNHYIYSRYHHYCAACEIEFASPGGLRYHIEFAPVHCDDSDDEKEEVSHEWEEEMGQRIYPEEPADAQDDDSDNSWEDFDDYDYEDVEELEPPIEIEEKETEDGENTRFVCPLCCQTPQSVCCTPCLSYLRKAKPNRRVTQVIPRIVVESIACRIA
ncbi:RING-type domain-containing protein [Mycena indigotica]|uniref:RING-type domain-containing protein n=1 Tax=Mycena indigotica TaxID=2126181 RepID=A0A8H6SGD1_9AGAR|nr:RING-type domain-containing protein [Mycena indigotica]KAF7299090.1 RING-type domain-containing protein [Mycena indigotica]